MLQENADMVQRARTQAGNLAHAVPVLATLFLVLAGVATPDWRLPVASALVVAGSAQRVQVARRHPPEGTPVPAPAGSGACGAAW